MTEPASRFRAFSCAAAALALLASGLGGCADMGDSFVSGAFVDPAKYEQFDCKQLEAERQRLALATAELKGLISKAETGVAGSVVGEMVYRNDYISARAQAKLMEEQWRRDKCATGGPASAAAPGGVKSGAPRSGSAVY